MSICIVMLESKRKASKYNPHLIHPSTWKIMLLTMWISHGKTMDLLIYSEEMIGKRVTEKGWVREGEL